MSMMMPPGDQFAAGPPGLQGGPFAAPPEEGLEEAGGDPAELYRQILDLLAQARQSEDSEQDRLSLEKVSTLIQQLLADEEKEEDEAMAGKMSPSLLRRAYGG